MSPSISVLLVDDHELFRQSTRALLESHGLIEVVGEASTGEEAVERVRSLEPEVVVMDISMPELGGLEATRRIADLGTNASVLALTADAARETVESMAAAGVVGYLTKDAAEAHLPQAVRAAARDEVYLCEGASGTIVEDVEIDEDRDLDELSPREQEVFALTARQYSASEIGEQLGISPKSVDTYRARMQRKLDLDSRRELVRLALQAGVLSRDGGVPQLVPKD